MQTNTLGAHRVTEGGKISQHPETSLYNSCCEGQVVGDSESCQEIYPESELRSLAEKLGKDSKGQVVS